ncbi:unnamed protein product [Linum trigynum]|uniref:Uncharacterized protein n=1 Tax=Linum trigynum TaxID=586398 RepID=A0AAV2DQZ4_9ROSI
MRANSRTKDQNQHGFEEDGRLQSPSVLRRPDPQPLSLSTLLSPRLLTLPLSIAHADLHPPPGLSLPKFPRLPSISTPVPFSLASPPSRPGTETSLPAPSPSHRAIAATPRPSPPLERELDSPADLLVMRQRDGDVDAGEITGVSSTMAVLA